MRYRSVLELIGNTPLVELRSLSPHPGVEIYAKLEGQNPSGSIKDRIALSMILDAEARGILQPGSIVLEPTSGNTGIALAMLARMRGYKFVAVLPDNVTKERRQLLEIYGTSIFFSDGSLGSNGAVKMAKELVERDPRYVMLYQYGNDANPRAHANGTAAEIIADLPDLDVLVAGLGTGGTLMGCARRLKAYNPDIRIVAAEPEQGEGVQGLRNLADGFIPPIIDLSLLDSKLLITAEDAIHRLRQLKDQEGILAGPSGGAALHAALRVASTLEKGKIVVILADGGWKYLSEDLWLRDTETLVESLENKVLW